MTPEYRAWIADLFAPLGEISIRRVFKSHGIYIGETMFGIVADQRIWLKTDETSRKAFQREGSTALAFAKRGGDPVITSYWEIPGRLYDESEEFVRWARQAYEIALNSPTAKRRRGRTNQ